MPVIFCDGADGGCDAWEQDFYEACASTVGGVQVTRARPAPGWTVTDGGEDLCPAHPAVPGLEVHKPFTDDGVTYCGWDGHDGCGEVWPCAYERAMRRVGAYAQDVAP